MRIADARVVAMVMMVGGCNQSRAQQVAPESFYRAAYEYLRQSDAVIGYCREMGVAREDCKIAVADTVVFPSYMYFSRDLVVMRQSTYPAIVDSLVRDEGERQSTFKPYSIRCVIQNPDQPALTAFFSSLNGNLLTAEITGPYAKDQSFQFATSFGTSIVFLFVFDERGHISKVIEKHVQA